MTAPAWSPDQKLRADATSVEIRARFDYLDDHMPEEYEQEIWDEPIVAFYIAHEFAAAKLAVGADAEPTPRKPYNGDVCGMCGGEYSLNGDGTWRPTHYPKCPRAFEPVLRGGAPASGGETPK